MNENLLKAYCSIVQAISEHSRSKAAHDNLRQRKYYPDLDSNQAIYSNDFMRKFEATADTLHLLKIMKPLDKCCSIFECEPQHELELVKINWSKGPSFSNLLEGFIDLFGEFGTEYWGFGTSPNTAFKPKGATLESAMNALVSVGYAETRGGGFRWTDKAASAMIATGFWHSTPDFA